MFIIVKIYPNMFSIIVDTIILINAMIMISVVNGANLPIFHSPRVTDSLTSLYVFGLDECGSKIEKTV